MVREKRAFLARKFTPVEGGVSICFRLPGGERRQHSFASDTKFKV